MEVTPNEAEESLAAINAIRKKMRHAVSNGNTHYFLILWGVIWVVGFLGSYFLSERTAGHLWAVIDIAGGVLSWVIGWWMSRRVRSAGSTTTSARIGFFWLALFLYCMLAVWIAWPLDSRQLAMLVTIFAMLGWIAMGFLLSVSLVKLALFITALALGATTCSPTTSTSAWRSSAAAR